MLPYKSIKESPTHKIAKTRCKGKKKVKKKQKKKHVVNNYLVGWKS